MLVDRHGRRSEIEWGRVSMTNTRSKVCTICGESKPLTAFYAEPRRKDGRRARCIPCYILTLPASSGQRTPVQRAAYKRRVKVGDTSAQATFDLMFDRQDGEVIP